MHADAIIYHNYFKSPNLALHRILRIHLHVKRCRSVFAHGNVASFRLTGSEEGQPGRERLGGCGDSRAQPPLHPQQRRWQHGALRQHQGGGISPTPCYNNYGNLIAVYRQSLSFQYDVDLPVLSSQCSSVCSYKP